MAGRTRTLHLVSLATAIGFAVGACAQQEPAPAGDTAAAADTTAPPPPEVAAPSIAAITGFLTSAYGPNAATHGEWSDVPLDTALRAEGGETAGDVMRKVCEHDEARYDGQPAVLLAVCGSMKDFGHPTPGVTDFFLLQGDPLAAVATSHLQEFGSMGSAGEVDSEQFGANLPGFTVESGFTGQGYTVVSRTLLLPKDGRFHDAGTFRSAMNDNLLREGCKDNANAVICKPGKAFDVEFDMDIDDSDATAAAYPILVSEEGEACGETLDAEHRLTLDPATLTYAIPETLKREGC